jgi:hypothetical protein
MAMRRGPGYLCDPEFSESTFRGRRTIALDPATVAALRDHRKAQVAERLAFGSGYVETGLVFCLANGSAIDPDGLTQQLARHIREVRASPHPATHYATPTRRAR